MGIAIGGLERVQLLIAIARFDTDGDNNVSEMEFMKSAYAGGVCVTNAVSGVQGFNLMASLIFVATHLANIGRPKPWYASPETVESFGAEESSIVMWVAYSLNCFAETLALSIMINSVFMRQLLSNSLPSVMSQLVFLADTNIVSVIATLTTWMLAAVLWVVALGGLCMPKAAACTARGSPGIVRGRRSSYVAPANRWVSVGADAWLLELRDAADRCLDHRPPHVSSLLQNCSQERRKKWLACILRQTARARYSSRSVVQAPSRSERRLALGQGFCRQPRAGRCS